MCGSIEESGGVACSRLPNDAPAMAVEGGEDETWILSFFFAPLSDYMCVHLCMEPLFGEGLRLWLLRVAFLCYWG